MESVRVQRVNTAFPRTSKDIDGFFGSSAGNGMILCVTLKNVARTGATSGQHLWKAEKEGQSEHLQHKFFFTSVRPCSSFIHCGSV